MNLTRLLFFTIFVGYIFIENFNCSSIKMTMKNIRNIYEDVQISETFAGPTLYKTVKKLLHDPNTTIFDNDKSIKNDDHSNLNLKPIEIIKLAIDNYLIKNSYNKLSIDMGDMSDIRDQLKNYKNRVVLQDIK